MSFDPASRFKAVTNPPLAPAVCWVTKVGDGVLVDTGVNIEFSQTGRLYLSEAVIREMADGLGLGLIPEDLSIQDPHEAYRQGYADGLAELEELRGTVTDATRRLCELLDPVAARGGVADLDAAPAAAEADAADAPSAGPSGPSDEEADGDPAGGAGGDPASDDDRGDVAEQAPRQGNRPRRQRRPAGVPAAASGNDPLAI